MRRKRPDLKNAQSILQAAERDMTFTRSLEVSEASHATIVRNIYESFRMLGDALLVSQGIVADDHKRPIDTLTQLQVKTKRPLHVLDNLRNTRHNINYNGYQPTKADTLDAIDIAEACFIPLLKEVKQKIKN